MAFLPVANLSVVQGVYNASAATWGGYPVLVNGTYHLFHAQMADGGNLGTWKTNSFVARSTAARVNGPYQFQEMVLPPFAHNPTIRRATDGTFVLYSIGGWHTKPTNARGSSRAGDGDGEVGTAATCAGGATIDNKTVIRVGGDYRDVLMPANSTVADCVSACCADAACRAFSFNTPPEPGADAPGCPESKGASCCKLKHTQPGLQPSGCPTCQTGTVPHSSPPSSCSALDWPKSACGPAMPGPTGDTCGAAPLNAGCGLAMATAPAPTGPWTVQALNMSGQWASPELYCAHTNPSPFFSPGDGAVYLAFNAGFCSGGLETIGLARAASYRGPYEQLPQSILRNPDNSTHHCEDPFLWRSPRGWHLLVHNQQGPQGESAYAVSTDFETWTLSPVSPYDCTVQLAGGGSTTFRGCGNRPHLVFGASGQPEWLINGAFRNTAGRDGGGPDSFTLFRPLVLQSSSRP